MKKNEYNLLILNEAKTSDKPIIFIARFMDEFER